MVIDPRAIGFDLTQALRDHVQLRIQSELRHFSPGVLRVTVRLDDINGDHGGSDKRCAILATLRGRRVVHAEATHANLYLAIDHAAEKLRGVVRRAFTRHLAGERKGPQRPGALWQLNSRWNAPTRTNAERPYSIS